MRPLVLALLILCLAGVAAAEPRHYDLVASDSSVEFTYTFGGVAGKGKMPIQSAELTLDLVTPERSSAAVGLDVAHATTANPLATDALKSRDVLDAADYPRITFVSRKVRGNLAQGATVSGDVTIRGVTRPMVLDAQVYRRQGAEAGDLSRLSVLLTGSINRSEFGATGFADLVADRVDLRILVRLVASGS